MFSGADYNCGLWDQIEALKFVKQEIANFGGDPDNISVFGISAGAMSISCLLSTPEARPYFKRALLQSGSCFNVHTLEDAKINSNTFAEELGISPQELTHERLSTMSAEKILALQCRVRFNGKMAGILPYNPVVDGELLREHPIDALEKGFQKE